jgi:hypothetical protein
VAGRPGRTLPQERAPAGVAGGRRGTRADGSYWREERNAHRRELLERGEERAPVGVAGGRRAPARGGAPVGGGAGTGGARRCQTLARAQIG